MEGKNVKMGAGCSFSTGDRERGVIRVWQRHTQSGDFSLVDVASTEYRVGEPFDCLTK
jgi:hypothetical protein